MRQYYYLFNRFLYLVFVVPLFVSGTLMAQETSTAHLPDSAALKNASRIPQYIVDSLHLAPPPTSNLRIEAAPANDNFTSATNIPIGTTLTGQTTNGGSLQGGENIDCNSGATTSIWYKFTVGATTTLYVNTQLTSGGYYVGTAVWNTSTLPTGSCPAMQCQDYAFGPVAFTEQLTGLVTGQTYYIQVVSSSNTDANQISIGVTTSFPGGSYVLTNPMPASSSSTCATAYSACFLDYCNATYAQVSGSCPAQTVSLTSNSVYTTCYTFTNANTNAKIGIQAYLTSNCSGGCSTGNVNWLDWTLYDASCNLIGCGNLNNLQVSGAGCNKTYTVCQTFEVTSYIYGVFCNKVTSCSVTQVIPYASWSDCSPVACTVLPIQLASFNVEYQQVSNSVDIYWSTATETNNKEFYIERSVDGVNYTAIDSTEGAGNSSTTHYYTATDENPYPGISYYKLKQVDFDGRVSYSEAVPMNIPANYSAHIFPNPTNADMTLRYSTQSQNPVNVVITDLSGKVMSSYTISDVQAGVNNYDVHTSSLAQGMYFMKVSNPQKTFYLKFVKQ